MFEFSNDLNLILKTLNLSLYDLSNELGFEVPTLSNWLNNKYEPDRRSKEDIYEFAYKNGLRINLAYEKPINNLGKKQGFIPLYHGSKDGIKGELSFDFSNLKNDFGLGFYCGEKYEQSATFVSDYKTSKIYLYGIYPNDLKIKEFTFDNDWMLNIAYNRGLLDDYKDSIVLKKIINKTKNLDIIIAPIADNRMFNIVKEFTDGNITDDACSFALCALNLGKQYVFKTNKALMKIGFIKEFYYCKDEKEDYKNYRTELTNKRYDLIKHFRSQHREGKFIDQLL